MSISTKSELLFTAHDAQNGSDFLAVVAHERGVELRHVKWVCLCKADIETAREVLLRAWEAHEALVKEPKR